MGTDDGNMALRFCDSEGNKIWTGTLDTLPTVTGVQGLDMPGWPGFDTALTLGFINVSAMGNNWRRLHGYPMIRRRKRKI